MERSVPGDAPVTRLINHFTDQCQQARIPFNRRSEGGILRQTFSAWQRQKIHFHLQMDMIDEFVRHPDWSRRSVDVTALVFTKKKTQLLGLVRHYEQKHASERNRHNAAAFDWTRT